MGLYCMKRYLQSRKKNHCCEGLEEKSMTENTFLQEIGENFGRCSRVHGPYVTKGNGLSRPQRYRRIWLPKEKCLEKSQPSEMAKKEEVPQIIK